jgi:hypothetical protein
LEWFFSSFKKPSSPNKKKNQTWDNLTKGKTWHLGGGGWGLSRKVPFI